MVTVVFWVGLVATLATLPIAAALLIFDRRQSAPLTRAGQEYLAQRENESPRVLTGRE